MEESMAGDEEGTALEALRSFRERSGSAEAECLIGRAEALDDQLPQHRRREELLERAESEQDMEREVAELVYELALDEGLEPAFAFELVRCGIGVQDHDVQVYGDALEDEEMTASAPPEELLAAEEPNSERAARERLLRSSFRRLRRHLEETDTAEAALRAFTAEPDVGPVRFL
jgi:spore cortex formation protein SpoVR/YcgB (stage V sporulation)